jgi:hypothetical protein
VVVVPCYGLCNRLQVLTCGRLLAEDTGREFVLDWHPVSNCAASFEDLFSADFPEPDGLAPDTRCYSSVKRGVARSPYREMLLASPKKRFGEILRDPSPVVVIVSGHQFLGYFHDPRFGPRLRELFRDVRPEIASEAEAFRKRRFTEHTVGVHVRRTDWGRQRTLQHYLRWMDGFPGATFFVSSDDPTTFPEIREHHPGAIEFPKASLSRGERAGIEQALVDVILLSETSYLIGTPGSSFSAVAQAAGDIPGIFDYGLSVSMRDLKLGNLIPPARDKTLAAELGRWATLARTLGRRLRRHRPPAP